MDKLNEGRPAFDARVNREFFTPSTRPRPSGPTLETAPTLFWGQRGEGEGDFWDLSGGGKFGELGCTAGVTHASVISGTDPISGYIVVKRKCDFEGDFNWDDEWWN